MVDGDFVLYESRAIAAYLVNKYGKDDKLYPKDAEIRARVDQRLYFDMGVFYKAFGECVYPVMFGGEKPGQEKYDKLKETLGWMDGFVKDGKFSAGNEDLTIGDLALLATYSTMNAEAWFEKCVKLVPNYEKVNEEGAAVFGGFFKS